MNKELVHCSGCGKLTKPSRRTQIVMHKLDLNELDIHIRCSECINHDYRDLVKTFKGGFKNG